MSDMSGMDAKSWAAMAALLLAGGVAAADEATLGECDPAGDLRPYCSAPDSDAVTERGANAGTLPIKIVNSHYNVCLRPLEGSVVADVVVSGARCRNQASYYWLPEKFVGDFRYRLKNMNSGYCLQRDEDGGYRQRGCSTRSNQIFSFEPAPWPPWGGDYLQVKFPQAPLESCIGMKDDGTTLHRTRCENRSTRRWHRSQL